jgi:hypothetical protein
MAYSVTRLGALTSTLPFLYEHDGGRIEEPIQYKPAEVDKSVMVAVRKNEDGTEETRVIEEKEEAGEGWEKREELFWEWIDRVVCGALPLTSPKGDLMTATQIATEYKDYRFILREIETQLRQHHNPLSRSLMELNRQR